MEAAATVESATRTARATIITRAYLPAIDSLRARRRLQMKCILRTTRTRCRAATCGTARLVVVVELMELAAVAAMATVML